MAKKKRFGVSQALTRGLTETINVVENNAGIFRNTVLPLSRIELDPENPRKLAIDLLDIRQGIQATDPWVSQKQEELERLKELAATIASTGVINPIVVYKRGDIYRVVAGERRCLASVLAGKQEIDARVFNEKPKGFDLKLVQWVENTARDDLSLDERLDNIRDLIKEYCVQYGDVPITATLLKDITSLSLPQATYYLTVLNAPDDVKTLIKDGTLRSLDKAALIASITAPAVRQEAITACIEGYSLKQLRSIVTKNKILTTKKVIVPNVKRRGRTSTRVNMGYTANPKVVKQLIDAVLLQERYKKYVATFNSVNWDYLDQATKAFRQLIDILELEQVG
ncbi:MAG: hypothetical protein A3E83_04530 [Gammaproteobacteria bacterium RIFCSPHIGHO2_12_FULL_41_20]|nr:MAG: hypothetical protein A3E83_04530 [Gammaproteobacteria bacterium RIFCSPHIGHO2_12_FULL_41_20]